MANGRKKPNSSARGKQTVRRTTSPKSDLDRRWSILLFGLGLLFIVFSLLQGESAWAWIRQNILFGALGVSGWLLGPMLIYWAVLIATEKPVFPPMIKGFVFMVALSGVALVFSDIEFAEKTFSEVLAAAHTNGYEAMFGGGILGLLVGGSLLALAGPVAARVLLVLLMLLATMVLTGVSPGDVVRFFRDAGDKLSERFDDVEEDFEDEVAPVARPQLPAVRRPVPPVARSNQKMQGVDVPLDAADRTAAGIPRTAKTNQRMHGVDIPLDEAALAASGAAAVPLAPPAPKANPRMRSVDIPLEDEPGQTAQPGLFDGPMFRDSRVDIDLRSEGVRSTPGVAPNSPVDIGPGGTFGQAAVQHANSQPYTGPLKNEKDKQDGPEEYGLGDDFTPIVAFGPGATVDAVTPPPKGDVLLFGEDDPYANLGGPTSKLPHGSLLDVEYIPPEETGADPGFDLFDGGQAQTAPGQDTPTANDTVPATQMDVIQRAVQAAAEQPPDTGAQDMPPQVFGAEQQPQTAGELPPQEKDEAPFLPGEEENAPTPEQMAMSEDPQLDKLLDKAAEVKDDTVGPAGDTRGLGDVIMPYQYPPSSLFETPPKESIAGARDEMKKTAELLVNTLHSFGVETSILDVSRGPSVTRYEIQPQAGVKISRITGLADDIALNLAAAGVRIEAPIPGKPAVGIEVPNRVKSSVPIRSILESSAFVDSTSPLSIALGKDIAGDVVVADLTKMPHLLIAGSTGSGKSVCINSIIMSFLYKSSPEEVRLILIDPKVVELAEYNGIPHLLIPVVTEPKQAAKALGYAVNEMEKRYHLFAEHGTRDINSFNKMARRTGKVEPIPHIAIVIDELADLMMVAGKDVENFICRIAQKARAAGMHLIVATQRPSVDVITGLIKSNIPSRIAFAVSSQVDSRTILDGAGAEKLLGMGDMLFMPIGANKPVRVQGTFVKDKEISRVLNYVKEHAVADYDNDVLAEMDKVLLSGAAKDPDAEGGEDAATVLADETFQSAVEMALEAGEISTSGLQRRLRLGYARAGRIVDQMEQMGIVSEPNGSKPRQVLISRQTWQEMVMNASE